MNVLIACEFSGVVRDAFIAKGHKAVSCDLLPTENPGPHYKGDVLRIMESYQWDLMIAHPPCTFLTVTGNKWMKPEYRERFPNRLEQRQEAIDFFMEFAESEINKIAIENPIGIMSTKWRKPDQIIHPNMFGHNFKKATCLWLKNLPKLEATNIVEPEWKVFKSGKRMSMEHYNTSKLDPDDRWKARSITPLGIAIEMAEQWGNSD